MNVETISRKSRILADDLKKDNQSIWKVRVTIYSRTNLGLEIKQTVVNDFRKGD